MPNNTQDPDEDMTPELRKALVELAVLAPTTPEEVELFDAGIQERIMEPAEIDDVYAEIQTRLAAEKAQPLPTETPVDVSGEFEGLARAARKGANLDPETIKQIESDLAKARRDHPDKS